MKSVLPPLAAAGDEISALTALLQKTGQRLEVLTGGEVDSVVDRTGRVFLFKGVQAQLRHAEDSRQAAILNALPANIALLDRRGVIVSVNEAWRRFGIANALHYPGHAVGADYLDICDKAQGEFCAGAREAASGIRSVLNGSAKGFAFEYPCHSPGEQRWFLMTVTPLALEQPNGVVVMHLDVTERKRGEQELKAFGAAMDALADAIYLVDRTSMRFVHVNDAACRMTGRTREELMALKPWEMLSISRAQLESNYDTLIASGVEAEPVELLRPRAGGAQAWVELRRHALRSEDRWTIVTLVRDITERKQRAQELNESEARFRSLSMLSSDWFWEQDDQHRFSRFSGGEGVEGWGPDQNKAVGLHRWDLGGVLPISCSWEEHKRMLDAHKPFRKFEYQRVLGDGRLQYVEASGEAIFDAGGAFTGYRGVASEITDRKLAERNLLRFRAAMDGSGDAIVLVDRTSMRYIDVNQTLCDLVGYTRQELIGKTPMELFGVEREVLERDYDAMIADSGGGTDLVEGSYRHRDGTLIPVETRRRAKRTDEGWIIVGSARDITARRIADSRIQGLNRVHAVLSSINALIVRVQSRDVLFTEACRIAVEQGGFRLAWIGIVDQGAQRIVPAASAGEDGLLLAVIKDLFSSTEGALHGNTLAARSMREKTVLFSNDSQNDPKVVYGHRHAESDIGSMVMLPLIVSGESIGVFALYSAEIGTFDDAEITLLTGLAGDIAFALEHIQGAGKLARTSRVNAMLSGINVAIVHHHERSALFREVCRIAVLEGGFALARVIEVDPGGRARIAATTESDAQLFQGIVDAYNSDPFNSSSLLAVALRSEQLVVSNDVAIDPRIPNRAALTKNGNYALALLPIVVEQRIAGAVILRSREPGIFDEDEMQLLREMVSNLSFALEHIEKETKVRRLTRVYSVLSGINALIVRARDRDELFKDACQIAVTQGGFTLAWIGIVDRDAMELVPLASAGSTQDARALVNQRFRLDVDALSGNSLSARVIREKAVAISNDVQSDPEVLFKEEHALRGSRSMALLPLKVAGEVEGLLALYSNEVGFFDDEEVKLLDELAGDIAFAIDNLRKQERLDYLAYYDVLTGLANRGLFLERVAQYARSAASGGHKLAVFLIDLERFRNLNDSLGRPAGDALLKQVAAWLTHGAGGASLVARVDAGHFALVLPEIRPGGSVTRLIEKIMSAFMENSFRLDNAVMRIGIKAGIALFPDDGADADTLLRNAEAALKKAKARGERYLFYRQEMNAAAAGKLTLENQLRRALENSEFVLHYQPKVSLEDGKVTSCEALIRWNDPLTGLVPPGRFIPILEETGLIYDVGRWALRQAIEDYLRWRNGGRPAVRIAVNVSPLQLRKPGFIDEIEQVIAIEAAAAASLELEITESLIMEDVKHSIASLTAIRAMGVTIAIDDFGTGFSSLSYLAKLPVDTLKIDRSFVIDMTTGPQGLALVSTIINLAHSIKLKVVAEGVETEEQSRLLRLLRCNEMQGFLFSKPVPAEIFEAKFLAAPAAG